MIDAHRTLYRGDCLDFLRTLADGKVDLLVTDPPFGTGRDWGAKPISQAGPDATFGDRWRWEDVPADEWDEIAAIYPEATGMIAAIREMTRDGGLAAFLVFLARRIMEGRRVLSADRWSLYLHCGPAIAPYVRVVMDGLLGRSSFRSSLVWERHNAHNRTEGWGPVHDVILYYAGPGAVWVPVYTPHTDAGIAAQYRYRDERGRYRVGCLTSPAKVAAGASRDPWRGYDPAPRGRGWAVPGRGGLPSWFVLTADWADLDSQAKLDFLDEAGLIHWPLRGGAPGYKIYLEENPGIRQQDLILGRRLAPSAGERTGYPTQKPLALLDLLIQSSSRPGDMVLDPFCGSGTALWSAERSGRRWMGADISPRAIEVTIDRLTAAQFIQREMFGEGPIASDPVRREDIRLLETQESSGKELWAADRNGPQIVEVT